MRTTDDAGATARDLAALLTTAAKNAIAAAERVSTPEWSEYECGRTRRAFDGAANPAAILTLCAELDRLALENALLRQDAPPAIRLRGLAERWRTFYAPEAARCSRVWTKCADDLDAALDAAASPSTEATTLRAENATESDAEIRALVAEARGDVHRPEGARKIRYDLADTIDALLAERTAARAVIARFAAMEARVREVRASIDASVRAYEGKSTLASIRGELVAVLAFVDTALCDDPDVADISIDDERLRELMAESTLAEQAEALARVCDDNDAPFAASALRKMAAALATQPPANTERVGDAIEDAARLLRDAGWTVASPPCPACNGAGFVMTSETWGSGATAGGSVGNAPCPRGCPRPMTYNSDNAAPPGTPLVATSAVPAESNAALATEPAASDG